MRITWAFVMGLIALTSAADRSLATEAPRGLQDYLKSKMRELQIPGMQVAVVQHQKIVLRAALGVADIENAVPVADKTVFPIASTTKAFTGVALMQLVESGKLELTAPISRYLDRLPGP